MTAEIRASPGILGSAEGLKTAGAEEQCCQNRNTSAV